MCNRNLDYSKSFNAIILNVASFYDIARKDKSQLIEILKDILKKSNSNRIDEVLKSVAMIHPTAGKTGLTIRLNDHHLVGHLLVLNKKLVNLKTPIGDKTMKIIPDSSTIRKNRNSFLRKLYAALKAKGYSDVKTLGCDSIMFKAENTMHKFTVETAHELIETFDLTIKGYDRIRKVYCEEVLY